MEELVIILILIKYIYLENKIMKYGIYQKIK